MSLLNSPRRQEVAQSFFCSWSFESWILLFDVCTDFSLLTRRNLVSSSFIMYRPLFPYLYYLNKEYSEFLKVLPFKCRMVVPAFWLYSLEYGEDPGGLITVLLLFWLMTETLTYWQSKTIWISLFLRRCTALTGQERGKKVNWLLAKIL